MQYGMMKRQREKKKRYLVCLPYVNLINIYLKFYYYLFFSFFFLILILFYLSLLSLQTIDAQKAGVPVLFVDHV